ncbi:unnamed protein product [Closterium sp. NIES-53]
MSFLRFRRGASENSYFKQESELKASKIRESAQLRSQYKIEDGNATSASPPSSTNLENSVDVLPDILSHRLPLASRSEPLMDVRPSPGGSGDAESNVRDGDDVSKSFAIATVIVAGGAAVAVAATFRALDVQTLEDLPVKGKAAVQPRIDAIARWLSPLNHQVQQVAAEWHMKEGGQSHLGSRIAEVIGARREQIDGPADLKEADGDG